MEYRNARFIRNGWIDCEINHPFYGWIPFTANPADRGSDFDAPALHAVMAADPSTLPYVPEPEPVPAFITRRQCALQLFNMGMISGAEAIAMTQTGVPPAAIQGYIDQLPEPDRTLATINFAADTYLRDNQLLQTLATTNNMTTEQLNGFFIAAFQL